MKFKFTFLLLMFLTTIGNIYSQFDANHPDLRLCGSSPNYYLNYFNCTSNNYTLKDVFLSLTDVNGVPMNNSACTIGSSQQVYILLNYTSNSSSSVGDARFFADIKIDGVFLTSVNSFLGTIIPGNNQRKIYGPFTWSCGQEITLNRMLVVWNTAGSSTELTSYNCNTYSKSQCDIPQTVTVLKPLAVKFTYKACRVGNNAIVNFNSTTNGGTSPYTYAWDLDNDGAFDDSNVLNPSWTYSYNPAGYSVTLKVTDSKGVNNTYNLNIIATDIMLNSETHTDVGCAGGTDGAINLNSPTGGTPPYTYSWNNGATTQNLSNLSAGNYTAIITDSNGCTKQVNVTINNGDSVSPTVILSIPNSIIDGCDTSAIEKAGFLPYSTTETIITDAVFNQNGGSFLDSSSISKITYQDSSVSGTCPKVITRTFKVTDACNNIGSTSKTFSIKNSTPPNIACAKPISANTNSGCTATNIVLGNPVISNNCGNVTVSNNHPSTTYSIGVTSVIWTATDICGNEATCTQTVTVTDNDLPTIVACAAPVNVVADKDNCSASNVNLGTPNVSDNCTLNPLTVTNDAPITFPIGTTTVTWTIKDTAGNTATCKQLVTVSDKQIPTIVTCAAPVNVAVGKDTCSASNVNLGIPNVSDNCNLNPLTIINDAPATFPIGTTTVTWTIKDVAGNTATCEQLVTVTDNQKPNTPVLLDVIGQCSASVTAPSTTDNCGAIIVATTSDPLTYNEQGTYIVHWGFDDGRGNSIIVNQNVIVDNTVPPSPPVLNDIIQQCSATVPIPTVINSCYQTIINGTTSDPLSYNKQGTYLVHWTFDDGNGNILNSIQNIIVDDIQAPIITSCASSVNVTTDKDTCSASNINLGTPIVSDNCAVVNITNNAPATFPIGTTTVTWTIKDIAGNTATCTQLVTVTDNQTPTLIACAAPVNISADKDACTASTVNLGTPDVSDNCTFNPLTITNDAPAAFPIGTTTVTWTIKDASGNTVNCDQTITVTDNQTPSIVSCAVPVNVNADAGSCTASNVDLGTPTFTDNCSISKVTITNDAPAVFPIGTTIVTWTIDDAAGNTVTCDQIVTVADNQTPSIVSCAAPVNVNADSGSCTATNVTLGTPTFTDNCSASEIKITNDAPSVFPIGTTIVTWTIKDAAGNTVTCDQTVTVTDNQTPSIVSCTAPVKVNADSGSCTATNVTLGTPTFTDNCSASEIKITNNAPTVFPIGTTIVTWTIKDAAGNTVTCDQTVTVTDNQTPTIVSCAAPVNVNADTGACTASNVTLGTPTFNDNCSLSEIKITNNAPAVFPIGTTIVTWTIKDTAGNTVICDQTVTVTDNQTPTIVSCAAPVNVNADSGSCTATNVDLGAPTFNDNCSLSEIKITNDAPAIYPTGPTTVTWTIKDAAGNTATCTQLVIIKDNEIPNILSEVPADTTVECSDIPSPAVLTASDNCDKNPIVTFSENKQDGNCPGNYILVRTWTATDSSGNSTSKSQKITVVDTTAPIFTSEVPKEISVECNKVPHAEVLEAIDNCGTATVSFAESKVDGSCLGNYTLYRTWTATDSCDNSTSFTQTLNVSDTEPPIILGTLDNLITVNCNEIPPIPQLEFSDNCSGVGEIIVPSGDDNIINKTDDSYTILRNWKVTDLCGNISTFIQTINVIVKEGLITASFDACNIDSATIDLNNLFPQEYKGLGTWTDLSSSGGLKGNNDGIFSPFEIPIGNYMIEYNINDPACPRKIQITANINDDCKVLPCGLITVHNFFSPNGDGYNDVFTIENISDFTCFPTNRVRIYNRWGALLYETEGYDNNEKAFRGISQASATVNQSAELPSGTYYYLLEYTADNKNYKESGYLYLSR